MQNNYISFDNVLLVQSLEVKIPQHLKSLKVSAIIAVISFGSRGQSVHARTWGITSARTSEKRWPLSAVPWPVALGWSDVNTSVYCYSGLLLNLTILNSILMGDKLRVNIWLKLFALMLTAAVLGNQLSLRAFCVYSVYVISPTELFGSVVRVCTTFSRGLWIEEHFKMGHDYFVPHP